MGNPIANLGSWAHPKGGGKNKPKPAPEKPKGPKK